ncbi:MAG: acyl-CoA dehydrogenase family protein [Patulibacter sp.]
MSDTLTAPVRAGSPELRRLFAEIAAGASEREQQGIAPFEQIRLLADAGVGRLRIPVAEGGAGASVRELFEVLIELAAADSNVAHILRVHFWFVEQQLQSADLERRARWIALINAGEIFGNGISEQNGKQIGLSGFTTTLTPDADDATKFRLTGEKFYSTGSLYSTWTQIFATTPDGHLAAVTVPTDREGVTIEDDWDGFGQRLTGTGTTRLENVLVHAEEFQDFGDPDDEQPPSYQTAFLQLYLQGVGAGILRAVQQDAVALVRRRKRSFSHAGAELPAHDPQVLQIVGEIAADAFAAEAIVLRAAEVIGAATESVVDGLPTAEAATAAQIAAAKAKVAVDRFANETTSKLFDVGGASATQAIYNLDRHWRNARTASTHNPTHLKASAVGDYYVNATTPPSNGFF